MLDDRETVNASSKNSWRIRGILFGGACAVALVGTIIGIWAGRQGLKNDIPVVAAKDSETGTEAGTAYETPESPAILRLPRVAVVDMARILAAHPMTDDLYESLERKLGEISPTADKNARHWEELLATAEWAEGQKVVARDVQQIIKAYAAEHHFTMVMDRTVRLREPSLLLYGENETSFHDIITAPGVKDITEEILQELRKQRPARSNLQPPPKVRLPSS